jgi:uncharacterized protein (DUF1015 family)
VPLFEPFAGLRYDEQAVSLDDVVAPPYDVIAEAERSALEARSPYNSVRLELPRDEAGLDRYQAAARLLAAWLAGGVLVRDDEPSFYVYRMGFHDEQGRPSQTTGVIGALGLSVPGEGDVLPHERTMPKPKDDRLNLLRATGANLSPVWGLSMGDGLGALCEMTGPPDARATDSEGVHHRLWRVTQRAVVDAIRDTVSKEPVIIADGHHRFETALAYQAERRQAGDSEGGHDLLMAYVVELSEEQLTVRAIHRLVTGVPEPVVDALKPWFEAADGGPADESLLSRMTDAGALGLVTRKGTWLLRPRPETTEAAEHDLDSSRLDVALAGIAGADVTYQHGVAEVVSAVEEGRADAAVLLRPAPVGVIAAAGRARLRMPPKTTFFYPKPRTGLVFREVHR